MLFPHGVVLAGKHGQLWGISSFEGILSKQLELDGDTNIDNPFLASLNPTTCHTQLFDFYFYSSNKNIIATQYINWYYNRSRLTSRCRDLWGTFNTTERLPISLLDTYLCYIMERIQHCKNHTRTLVD